MHLSRSKAAPAAAPAEQQDVESAASGSQAETAGQGQEAVVEESGAGFFAVDPHDSAELQKLLIEEKRKMAALIGESYHSLLTLSLCA